MPDVAIPHLPVNRITVEKAYGHVRKLQRTHSNHVAEVGMRAAMAKDQTLMKVLEKGAEILHQMSEEQSGETRRAAKAEKDRIPHTEFQLWKEAYRVADEVTGEKRERYDALHPFAWIYGAAALLCGYAI